MSKKPPANSKGSSRSKGSDSAPNPSSTDQSTKPDVYVDNAENRRLNRVGLPKGSMKHPRSQSPSQNSNNPSSSVNYNTVKDRSTSHKSASGGSSTGSDSAPKSSSTDQSTKPDVYVDNAENRRLNRVGLPKGSMKHSKSQSPSQNSNNSPSSVNSKTIKDRSTSPKSASGGSSSTSTSDMDKQRQGSRASKSKTSGRSDSLISGETSETINFSKMSDSGVSVDSMKTEEKHVCAAARSASSRSETKPTSAANTRGKKTAPGNSEEKDNTKGKSSSRKADSSNKADTFNDRNKDSGDSGYRSFEESGGADSQRNTAKTPRTIKGELAAQKSDATDEPEIRRYKNTRQNKAWHRVGKPHGAAMLIAGATKTVRVNYADTPINRLLGRVGKPRGSLPIINVSPETLEERDLFKRLKTEGRVDESKANKDALAIAKTHVNREAEEKSVRTSESRDKWLADLKAYKGKKIDMKDIKFKRKIGQGGFGEVYSAKWKGAIVAVKRARTTESVSGSSSLQSEVMTLSQLDHPNIVNFIGACITMANLCIVMEYMSMSLHDALHFKEGIDFSDEDRLWIIRDTATGLEYLHGQGIAHCDLKPHNILVDHWPGEECVTKITDFGLSMIKANASEETVYVRNVGTLRYSAPEVLRGDRLDVRNMMRADIYSLALVWYEVLLHQEPWYNYSAFELKTKIVNEKITPEIPGTINIHSGFKRRMVSCWNHDPKSRPTLNQVCETVRDEGMCLYPTK